MVYSLMGDMLLKILSVFFFVSAALLTQVGAANDSSDQGAEIEVSDTVVVGERRSVTADLSTGTIASLQLGEVLWAITGLTGVFIGGASVIVARRRHGATTTIPGIRP